MVIVSPDFTTLAPNVFNFERVTRLSWTAKLLPMVITIPVAITVHPVVPVAASLWKWEPSREQVAFMPTVVWASVRPAMAGAVVRTRGTRTPQDGGGSSVISKGHTSR